MWLASTEEDLAPWPTVLAGPLFPNRRASSKMAWNVSPPSYPPCLILLQVPTRWSLWRSWWLLKILPVRSWGGPSWLLSCWTFLEQWSDIYSTLLNYYATLFAPSAHTDHDEVILLSLSLSIFQRQTSVIGPPMSTAVSQRTRQEKRRFSKRPFSTCKLRWHLPLSVYPYHQDKEWRAF